MLFSVPDQLVCGPGANGNQQAGCDPNAAIPSTSHYNAQFKNKMGIDESGKADPNGTDFWWDPYRGTKGNCWYQNETPQGVSITQSPSFPPLPSCDDGKNPDSSIGYGNDAQTGELLSCLAAFETRQFDPEGPCPWFKTPPEPQPAAGAATARTADSSAFDAPFTRKAPKPAVLGFDRRQDLSGVNCANWNAAGDEDRAYIVDRITAFAGGSVNDGDSIVGYGDTLTDEKTTALFDNWCPESYAQGFLLYKLYTYASVVSKRDIQ